MLWKIFSGDKTKPLRTTRLLPGNTSHPLRIAPILLFCCFIAGFATPLPAIETVDHFSGRLSLNETDLAVTAGAGALSMQRFYLPDASIPGLFGARWTSNWEVALVRSESAVMVLDSGRLIEFDTTHKKSERIGPSGERLVLEDSGRASLQWPDGQSARFDPEGRLAEIADSNGNSTVLVYDEEGYLSRIRGPGNTALTVTTDEEGKVTRIRSTNGYEVTYVYNGENLVSVSTNGGTATRYSYSKQSDLTGIERPASGMVRLTYDDRHRLTSRTWADGSRERYAYDDETGTVRHVDVLGGVTITHKSKDGHREESIDSLGHKTLVEYGTKGNLVVVTGATGVRTSYRYDHLGRLLEMKGTDGVSVRFDYAGKSPRYQSITEGEGNRYDFTYDQDGNLLKVTRNGEPIHLFTYYRNGLLRSSWGEDFPERRYTYDDKGLVRTETDALGYTTIYQYDERSNLIRATDPAGGETEWAYDNQNRLVRRSDPGGAETRYAYDTAGRLVRMIDPLGQVSTYSYDSCGRLQRRTDPAQRTFHYQYDAAGLLTTLKAPDGSIFRYEYDLAGNLIREIDPLGGITTRSYNPLGLLERETDPAGLTRHYEYTVSGLLEKVVDPLGRVTAYTYDDRGNLLKVKNPAGMTTVYAYDKRNRRTKTVHPDGLIKQFTYDRLGRLLKVSTNQGTTAEYTYDAMGRIIRERSVPGADRSYRYDPLGRLLRWQDAMGGGESYQYAANGLPSIVVDAAGASTRYRYDPIGRLLEEIDPLSRSTTFAYSSAGTLKRVKTPSGDSTEYTYDQAGNLKEIRHPSGARTRYVSDSLGRHIRKTDPNGAETRRVFDKAGRLIKVTDGKGQTTTFAYDPAGRLTEKRLANGKTVTYQYDRADNLIKVDDDTFPVKYEYNKQGILAGIAYPAIKRRLRYGYDDKGLLKSFSDSEGRKIFYDYDTKGLLKTIRLSKGKSITFSYDEKGRRVGIVYPNGIRGTWRYDLLGRTNNITYFKKDGETLCGWQYAYDAAGNLVSVIDSKGKMIRYRYDPSDQLIEEAGPENTILYRYLQGGNRGERNADGLSIAYRYNKADQLLNAGDERFRYDANGNLVERKGGQGTTRYEYDTEDRLVRVITPDGSATGFGYAPTDERIWRRDGSGCTYYVTDGHHLLAELSEDLNPKATYLHASWMDLPLMMWREGQDYFYHSKHLGSVAELTDSKGNVSASYETDSFGSVVKKSGALLNPMVFTGREYDPVLGLYYYRSRYYDPVLGRFLSSDKYPPRQRSPLTFNSYLYVLNNPNRYTDPLGALPKPMTSVDVPDSMRRVIFQATPQHPYYGNIDEWASIELGRPIPPGSVRGTFDPRAGARVYPSGYLNSSEKIDFDKAAAVGYHEGTGHSEFYEQTRPKNIPYRRGGLKEWKLYDKFLRENPNLRMKSERVATWQTSHYLVRERGLPIKHPLVQEEIDYYVDHGGNRSRLVKALKPWERSSRVGGNAESIKPLRRPRINLLKRTAATKPPAPTPPKATPEAVGGGKYRLEKIFGKFPERLTDAQKRGAIGGFRSGVEKAHAPIIHLVVTTKQLLECKERKLDVRKCMSELIKSNAKWAIIRKLALTAGGTKAAVLLKIAGMGMMYFQLVHDTANLLYNMSSWLAAEYHRLNAEEQHEHFAQVNLETRLDEDIDAMRQLIVDTLERPVLVRERVCRAIKSMIEQAAQNAKAAEDGKAALANVVESYADWRRAVEKCETATRKEARLTEILSQNQDVLENLREHLQKASDIAATCRSKQDADTVREELEKAGKIGTDIVQKKDEARELARQLSETMVALATAKSVYEDALARRDRIIQLAEELPTEQELSEHITVADTATKIVIEEGGRLDKRVAMLRKGYPDKLKPEVEKKFKNLKWLIYEYRSRGACNTLDLRTRFNKHAGDVVQIRLTVENMLRPFLDLHREIEACPTEPPDTMLMEIIETKVESETLLAKAHEVYLIATECEKASDQSRATVILRRLRPLVDNFAETAISTIDAERHISAPNVLKMKAGQQRTLFFEYAVSAPPGSSMNIRIEPSVVGWVHYSGKERRPLKLKPIVNHVRMGERQTQRSFQASLPFQIHYPSREEGGKKSLLGPHDLHLDVFLDTRKLYSLVIYDAFEVSGPGTDFNGIGDLDVCVLDADGKTAYPGKVRISLGGASQVTKNFSSSTCTLKLGGTADFPRIRLGAYTVRAVVLDDADYYQGPRSGSTGVTLFRWNPSERHVKPWFGATVVLGEGTKKPGFIEASQLTEPQKPQGPREWYITVNVIDKKKRGISGARVFAAEGAMAAKEKSRGKYLLGPIRNIQNLREKTISVVADISFSSPLSSSLANQRIRTVVLKQKPHVDITIQFDITSAPPAFIGATGVEGGTAGGGGGGTTGGSSNTTSGRTGVSSGSSPGSTGTGKTSDFSSNRGDSAVQQGGAFGGDGGSDLGPRRSRDECIHIVCPMCGSLLFSATPDRKCMNCIEANEKRIQRCMEGYKDF